ncbi:Hypothetical protein EIN_338990, partial [Entamoeba invadens IP1]
MFIIVIVFRTSGSILHNELVFLKSYFSCKHTRQI